MGRRWNSLTGSLRSSTPVMVSFGASALGGRAVLRVEVFVPRRPKTTDKLLLPERRTVSLFPTCLCPHCRPLSLFCPFHVRPADGQAESDLHTTGRVCRPESLLRSRCRLWFGVSASRCGPRRAGRRWSVVSSSGMWWARDTRTVCGTA